MGEDEDSQDVRSRPAPRASLLNQVAPQLLAERGTGVLLAAKFIGEIADINRFQTDSQRARLAGLHPDPRVLGKLKPLPAGSWRQPPARQRLLPARDHRHPPRLADGRLPAKQRANGKTNRDAIRSLKRDLVHRVSQPLRDAKAFQPVCLRGRLTKRASRHDRTGRAAASALSRRSTEAAAPTSWSRRRRPSSGGMTTPPQICAERPFGAVDLEARPRISCRLF